MGETYAPKRPSGLRSRRCHGGRSAALGPSAADHGDAPGVRVDPRLDLPDVYAFQSPSSSANVVFIMTMAPLARIVSQNNFHPRADHDFFVNTNADPDYEFAFNFRFGPPGPGEPPEIRFVGESRTGATLRDRSARPARTIALPGGGFFRANEIDDPFFFDFIAFRSGLGEPVRRRRRQHGRQLLPRPERHGDRARAAAVVLRHQQHRRVGANSRSTASRSIATAGRSSTPSSFPGR